MLKETQERTALENTIAEIQARYEPKIKELQTKAEETASGLPSKEEIMVNIDVDEWEEVEWILDIPEVTWGQTTIKMHIPEVTMRLKRMVFDLPEPTMVYKKFPWGGGMHVPGVTMKRHEIKTKIPEVTMRLQTIKLHVPKITMKEQRMVFDLPKINFGGPRDEIEAKKTAAEGFSAEAQALSEAMSDEIEVEVKNFLHEVRTEVAAQFEGPLAQLRGSVAGAPNDTVRAELQEELLKLQVQRDTALADIDRQIALID